MHPGCCKILDFSYNSRCCLIEGHGTFGASGVLMKNHLCEACRVQYIENNFDTLTAAGQFPCGPHTALTPWAFVTLYSQPYKTSVVEGDPGYVEMEPDPWAEVE